MKRTTIFAEESLLDALQNLARRENLSLSAVIRAALHEYCGKHQASRLPSFFGIGRSGMKDVAERAEELLWAAPHTQRKRRT
jgi:predicted DNA-binding ribbon-helix-helix protein